MEYESYAYHSKDYWTQTMLWYCFDYASWSKHRKSNPDLRFSSPASESQQTYTELEKKLKEAEEKQHGLEQQLKAAEDNQCELESRKIESADRYQEPDNKEKELGQREKKFESRAEALSAKEKEINAREHILSEKEAETSKVDDEGNGASRDESQNWSEQLMGMKSDLERTRAENERLKANEAELTKLQQEYKELKDSKANGNSSDSKAIQESRVGFRNEPVELRTRDFRAATTRSRLEPILLQEGFSRLPRLRT